MAANPYEDQFEYGPDGLPIKKLPSTAPSMAPQERTLPSLGNPIPAQPSVGLASPALAVSTQPPRTLESLAPTNSFNNSSVPNFATARGGYVGARTDAEAARNMQSRMEQDQAAQYMVQSMNRGATAMNDLRATKLGISSGTLAAMEGRPGGEWASSGPLLSVGKEGVNFGDEASRQSQIDGLLSRAASQTGFGGSKRSAAMLAAAQGMMAPQMAQQELEYGLAGKQKMCIRDRHSHPRVVRFSDYGVGSNIPAARALFLGAQAAVAAFGSGDKKTRYSWSEHLDDRGNQVVVASSAIYGIRRNDHNGVAMGVIGVDTYSPTA